MNSKYILVAMIMIGCGGSEFTSLDTYPNDAGLDSKTDINDSQMDNINQSDISPDTDVNQPDVNQPDVNQPDVNQPDVNQPDVEITCLLGCEKQDNECYCPQPECCGSTDCDPFGNPPTVCKSGACTANSNAPCDLAGCNIYCVNCYNDTFKGHCDGQCTCEKI